MAELKPFEVIMKIDFGANDGITAIARAEKVVELVRCKDCKHWDKTWTNDWSPDYHYCPMIEGVRNGDFYCADGERRE